MPPIRYHDPARLLGAASFPSDLRGSLNAVKLVKSQEWVWKSLREACELEKKHARHRYPGHWELAAVGFVASRQVNIRPWWEETSAELWTEVGFKKKPTYPTTWRRLRELESVCEEFLNAAALVIKRCKMHDSRVMSHVHFDFTEDSTSAALVHDCQKDEKCSRPKTGDGPGRALRPARASSDQAREERHDLSALDQETSSKLEKATAPQKVEIVTRNGRKIKRVRVNGCWFRTLDLDGGIRAYSGRKGLRRFWHGYYAGKGVDHFTGGVIPSVDNASVNEAKIFPTLFDRVTESAGVVPETAIADRGLSLAECFEHVTRSGAAPVFPWRAKNGADKRPDTEEFDRHGVKRCRFCGGPMQQIRFSAGEDNPRLWFSCTMKTTPECAKDQTISCKTDWRTLIPLPRTEPLYHELKQSHQTYEAVHHYWRTRYRVAGDDPTNTPRVVSIGWHRLRANVACLIDWLRIAKKNDWLRARKKKQNPNVERRFKSRGERAAKSLIKTRVFYGLAARYGPAAKKLGLGKATLPSDRPPPKLASA
jgi:hypothetical protein